MSTINPASDLTTNPLMSIHVPQERIEPVIERAQFQGGQGTAIVPRRETVVQVEREVTDEESEGSAPQEYPTDSHELAQNHEGSGAAEVEQDGHKVKDLGWDKEPEEILSLFSDYTNDELWILIRRFNQQVYHVRSVQTDVPSALDLNTVYDDEFSPGKLGTVLQRLYMTAFVGVLGFVKHIARLRSWQERKRTASFCAIYFLAWFFNLLMPILFTLLLTLILYPPSRPLLFPPAPLSLTSTTTGGLIHPRSGVLATADTVTGAPEAHPGESLEREAANFVASIAQIALSAAAGENPKANEDMPDPFHAATGAVDTKRHDEDKLPGSMDRTRKPVEDMMWEIMKPVMKIVGDISDLWERFANALEPREPFDKMRGKRRIAGMVGPLLAGSIFLNPAMVFRMSSFFLGVGFFGQPLISRSMTWLNQNYPHWTNLFEIKNTILKGVPTNAQLALTLLRIGESNNAPVPPPPRDDLKPPQENLQPRASDLPFDATQEEVNDAVDQDEPEEHKEASETHKKKKQLGSQIVKFFKGITFAGVEVIRAGDKVKAQLGSEASKDRIGILRDADSKVIMGPSEFEARHKGTRDRIHIKGGKMTWQGEVIGVEGIKELKKIGGLGWKARLVFGWATTKEIVDGVEILDSKGVWWKFTAVQLRDELFNRLIAMGGQKWECL